VAGGWRRLHDDKLHNMFTFPNIIRVSNMRRLRWAGYIAHVGEMRDVYRILVGKLDGNRPLGRPKDRW
jgi:hypothetical protein